jgi:hypothetical protein
MKKTGFAFVLVLASLSAFAQSGVIKGLTGQVELKSAGSTAFCRGESRRPC